MMLVDRRQQLPEENTGYRIERRHRYMKKNPRIERRQHRRQNGTRINHDFGFQCWEPEPIIKKEKFDFGMAMLLVAEIAVIAIVLASWVSNA